MFFYILVALAGILFAILFIELAVYIYNRQSSPVLSVACAGSEKALTPRSLRLTNLDWEQFTKEDGTAIGKDEYEPYITVGQSMLLGGIQDRDIIFVKKIVDFENIQFPKIMMLRREPAAMQRASLVSDAAEYKVRRSWGLFDIGATDDLILERVRTIVESETFRQLRGIDGRMFPTTEQLLSDLRNRLRTYRSEHAGCEVDNNENHKVIISTTLDTRNGMVHFSVHPSRTVVGEVAYAFGNIHLDAA